MKYQIQIKTLIKTYDNNLVIDIFNDLGYSVSFDKKENFFKFVEDCSSYKFQINISMKVGHTEIIWAVWKNGELQMGIPWILLKSLMGNTDQNIKYPIFRDYQDIKMILKESFLMYEDFKRELLSIYNNEFSDL